MRTIHYTADLCVIGGGLAGLCTAIAAARNGISTVLVHDRAVLGGNASEEIRMWVCGANGTDKRETGIIEELMLENYYQNPHHKYPLWSSVLYEKAMREPHLTLLLNSSCLDATMNGSAIVSIRAWQSNAETFHVVAATYFADCSGDSILSTLTGAAYTCGREAKADFNETIPPDTADSKTMGMSCLFQIRETPEKVPFTPPAWAYTYETDADLPFKDHTVDNNFWWIEVGGEGDCVHDTDKCRDELLKICYGVWDHMKNHGDHHADNWEIDWIGFLPGKRESRRYIGQYVVTQNDVVSGGHFDDIVAYAGWSMDDHFPAGFYHTASYPTVYHPAPSPWGLPLRAMLSANIDNLVFAGRNISVTHAALSSSRVMATCAILGQALGTAVAMAVKTGCRVGDVEIDALQQTLLNDDCYIPFIRRRVPALTRSAVCSNPVVCNGMERGEENLWKGHPGDSITYTFPTATPLREIRLVFDSDLNRDYDNMPCCYPLHETRYHLPDTLIKAYRIEGIQADGKPLQITMTDNHQRFVCHRVAWTVKSIRFVPLAANGSDEYRIFDFEVQ